MASLLFLGVRFLKVGIILLQNKVSASSSDSPCNSFDISSSVVWFTFFEVVVKSSSASESTSFCLRFFALALFFTATETLVFAVVVCPEMLEHSKSVVDDDDVDDDMMNLALTPVVLLLCYYVFLSLAIYHKQTATD